MRADLNLPAAQAPQRLTISRMTAADIRAVMRIESLSFATTWPQNAFASELNDNRLAHYSVGRIGSEIVAYGGIWVILEDSHITTIAVHPDWRSRKYGELMLVHLLEEAIAQNASWMTLEVRETNVSAQNLYRKYGFTVVSTRRGYYSDNSENALVMWAGNLRGDLYRSRLRALREALEAHIATRDS
ncbi:MAG TPA: ribosomal protein S18-alanine N-acetyltransferase [Candidatus Baltobacteraceae bacterium]